MAGLLEEHIVMGREEGVLTGVSVYQDFIDGAAVMISHIT